MTDAIATFICFGVFFYVRVDLEAREWKTPKVRNLAAGGAALFGAIAYGAFAGFTGLFL
jgi:hypothetical protein